MRRPLPGTQGRAGVQPRGSPYSRGKEERRPRLALSLQREVHWGWESHNKKPRMGIQRLPTPPLPWGDCLCGPSSQPLSPLYMVGPTGGCGAAAGGRGE